MKPQPPPPEWEQALRARVVERPDPRLTFRILAALPPRRSRERTGTLLRLGSVLAAVVLGWVVFPQSGAPIEGSPSEMLWVQGALYCAVAVLASWGLAQAAD